MDKVLIVIAVVAVVAIAAMVLLNPGLKKKGDAAIDRAKELLGGDVIEIEPKAVGLTADPPEAGTKGGMGCLALSASDLVFVLWGDQETMTVPRSAITSVECSADDPAAVAKAAIVVHFTFEGKPATAQFRVARDLVNWLTVLGYDWGPEGPPAPDATEDPADG